LISGKKSENTKKGAGVQFINDERWQYAFIYFNFERFREQARLSQDCAARTIAFPDKSGPH